MSRNPSLGALLRPGLAEAAMANDMPKRSMQPRRSAPSASLRLLCLCLGASRTADARERLRRLLREEPDWVGLAAVANEHLVAPTVWTALDRGGLLPELPEDFRAYLAAIHRANAIRGEAMRRQLRRAASALNAAEIVPVLLKGGARLFENTAEGDARMMADLDLLVEERRLDEALAILCRSGYRVVDDRSAGRFHATALRHAGEPAAIDIHRHVGPQRDFIPLAEALAGAVPLAAGDCRLLALAPTHRVMHVFFHAQIHDRGQASHALPLRQLEEFAWIAECHASAIDWAAIAGAVDRLRLRRAWDAWLHLAERCLGLAPAMPLRWRQRAARHYRRCLFLLDHRGLARVLGAALAVTEPLSYANIDYRYRCGASAPRLFRARATEVLRLCRKYGHRLPQRLLAALREAHEQAP